MSVSYYLWASYHRKILDKLLEKNKSYYQGTVLDIGGRDRGNFKKPKRKVKKWIFADINKNHHPDIILDISNMQQIKSNSINVVNVTEVFEHIRQPLKGLRECRRVLKPGGQMIISAPFLYQIHADPDDFQRWSIDKWRQELKEIGFKIVKIEIIGRYFSLLADMKLIFIKSLSLPFKWFFILFRPIIDLISKLDELRVVQNHDQFGKFHGGYFIVVRK